MAYLLDLKCEKCGHKWSQSSETDTLVLECLKCREEEDNKEQK